MGGVRRLSGAIAISRLDGYGERGWERWQRTLFHWSFERNRARRALDRLGPPGAVIEVDAVVGKLRLVEQQLVEIAGR